MASFAVDTRASAMPRVFRDANVCSAIPRFEMPCGASWAALSSVGVRNTARVSTDRVVDRQLLPDVSFRSGGSAPIRQVHSDSQLSAGLDALICVPKPAAQAGVKRAPVQAMPRCSATR